MRTLLFFLIIIMLSLISCNGNSESENTDNDTTATSQTPEPAPTTTQQECFRQVLSRDTFFISISQTADAISGNLAFDNYEKDSSKGTVTGTSSGDTLKLWYNFQSEGMNSVMEVYFKRQGDQLIRGVGSMDVKGDTSYFTNPSDIKFGEKDTWSKVACQ
jgi:hypothetical protein